MKYKRFFGLTIFFIIGLHFNVNARPSEIFKGRLAPGRFDPRKTPEDYYTQSNKLLEENNYPQALLCSLVIVHHFKDHVHYGAALKQATLCYLNLNQPDLADRYLAQYVKTTRGLDDFQDICSLKYRIAHAYSEGTRKHLYGLEGLPRVEDSKDDAIRIYDEIIASFPAETLAAPALFDKAGVLMKQKKYDESIKIFQEVIRRFPQNQLVVECCLRISQIYLMQNATEPQNTKYTVDATTNLQRMSELCPNRKGHIQAATKNLATMRERNAASLYDLARFYEKKNKPVSAGIYYDNVLKSFPETNIAEKCRLRIKTKTIKVSS